MRSINGTQSPEPEFALTRPYFWKIRTIGTAHPVKFSIVQKGAYPNKWFDMRIFHRTIINTKLANSRNIIA